VLMRAGTPSLEETVTAIERRGNQPILARPAAPNWRSDPSMDGGDSSESGSDEQSRQEASSTASVDASPDGDNPSTNNDAPAESAAESAPESTEADVSADRRSYF
jgi:hypothetical protein